jgi:hypothetical protein
MRRTTPLRNNPLANMLEDKRRAGERRNELVQRLMLANALRSAPPIDASRSPPREDPDCPFPIESSRGEYPIGEQANRELTVAPLSIDHIIDSADTSVRLQNCFLNHRDLFRQFTVAQAVLDREKFVSVLTKCQNLGRKTAYEVLSIIDLYQEKPWPIAGHIAPEKGGFDTEPEVLPPETWGLPKATLDEEITFILRNYETTTRLSNLLPSGDFDKITVADFMADPSAIKQRFMSAKNSGRKTANEAIGILSDHVEAARESFEESLDSSKTSADSLSAIKAGLEPPRQRLQGIIGGYPRKKSRFSPNAMASMETPLERFRISRCACT